MDEQNSKYISPDNTIEEINRDAKSIYKEKKLKRRAVFATVAVIAGVLLFGLIIVLTATLFFKIETITVTGNTCYSEEFLLETMGVKKGDSIFLANQNDYAKRVAGVCPMVYSVRVDKIYPNEIIINVTEEKPSYRFEKEGIWSVISKSGKVLYTGEDLSLFEGGEELLEITPPPVLESVMGYSIKYKDKTDGEAVAQVIEAIERSSMKDDIVYVTMNSRFDIRLKYLDRFEILLGNRQDISVKLKFANKMIEELKESDRGTINVKDAKKGYAIID